MGTTKSILMKDDPRLSSERNTGATAASTAATTVEKDEESGEPSSSSCAWDWGDCSSSHCCRGAGMQCYTKSGNWSACKLFCQPGVDPFDSDRRPWRCEALGRRAPGVEKTETCNPGRAGSEFWSGKELFSGDALSEEGCLAECQQKVGCA